MKSSETTLATILTCRLTDKDKCGDKMTDFLSRCFYQPGQYKEQADFQKLSDRMTEYEGVRSDIQLWTEFALSYLQAMSYEQRGLNMIRFHTRKSLPTVASVRRRSLT